MKCIFIAVCVLFFSAGFANAQNENEQQKPSDCIMNELISKVYQNELFQSYYPFIAYDRNIIEWNKNEEVMIFLNKMKESKTGIVRILHIGDSHIHSDIFTGFVRKRLQNLFGNGGRGLVFPFCTAGTHATRDYKTSCTGTWTSAKTTERVLIYDIGVTGVTARTDDVNATASIIFRPGVYKIPKKQMKVSVLYLDCENAFDVNLRSGKKSWEVTSVDSENGVMTGMLDWSSDTLTISFTKSDTTQKFFEMYGLVIEDSDQNGIIYSSAGINGSAMYHLVNQKLLEKHIEILKPDLLVLDLGTNDIYRGTFEESVLYKLLTTIVQKVRKVVPEACILLIPPQDMYYRKKHIVSTDKYSALLRKVAFEQGCLFWDYFAVSGGNYSMLKWELKLLAKKDRLHLSTEGYELKGKLFVMALLDLYTEFIRNEIFPPERIWEQTDSACIALLFNPSSLYGGPVQPDTVAIHSMPFETTQTNKPASSGSVTHIVKSGENLGLVAQKYGVTVAQLQQWNSIKGTTIYPGQKLILYGENATVKPSGFDNKQTTNSFSSPAGKRKITYTVKSGDSLYAIAKNHGTTVENIKKWNKLTTDRIHPGQQLIIYK